MIITNTVKNDKINISLIKKLAIGFYRMFKDLENEMIKDSNFMMEVNKVTTNNIGK